MIQGLAVPYGVSSPGGIKGTMYCEIIGPGAFRRSVSAGKCLQTGKPIYACLNHSRKSQDRLGSTADGRLRLWETSEGLFFEVDAPLPKLVTGVSVSFKPRRWRKDTGLLYRLLEADLVHIAILTWPKRPAYPATAGSIRKVN